MTLPSDHQVGPRRIRLIGIGSGQLDQLTQQARAALESVDYVIAAQKGEADRLLEIRQRLCAEHDVALVVVPDPERERADPADYVGAVGDWHQARVTAYDEVLRDRAGDVGFLVWGDPSLYDSTIRIAADLAARHGADWDVTPGVSALSLLAAAHRIVLHEVGKPLLITTGRRLLADAMGADNVAVYLDGSLTCARLPGRWQIWWGANLGTASEAILHGHLPEQLPQIAELREATKRTAGWVLDIYLLRRIAD